MLNPQEGRRFDAKRHYVILAKALDGIWPVGHASTVLWHQVFLLLRVLVLKTFHGNDDPFLMGPWIHDGFLDSRCHHGFLDS